MFIDKHVNIIEVHGACFKTCYKHILIIATLALGLQPKQRFAKVWAKNEARESHFMLLGL